MEKLSHGPQKTVAKKTFFQAFQSLKDSLGNLKLMVLL